MSERWKNIPGYEDLYQVSDLGRVRRKSGSLNCPNGRILKGSIGSHGYLAVNLCKGGIAAGHTVHSLVLTVFVGPCPDGMCARHLDGGKTNNLLENLAWGSWDDQAQDRIEHGTVPRSLKHWNGQLSDEDVGAIRSSGESNWTLAKQYDVTPHCIWEIRVGRKRKAGAS
jgi:hypothetical protein